jgi:GT2 family glycosyltransferase
MLIRREVIDQIGLFDEGFFAYQEDADYCLRARKGGWKIFYFPEAKITHFGGRGGSRIQPIRSVWEWHKSYYLYYRKHFAKDYVFLFNWFYYGSMIMKLCYSLVKNLIWKNDFGGSRKPG